MSKITLLIGFGVIVVLFLSGVMKVQFQPERISAVPGTVRGIVSDGGLLAAGKHQAIIWKRKGELYFADSIINKMELAMKYTEVDAASLMEALEQKKQPDVIIPNAELLLESVAQMKEFAGQLSDEELVALQDQARLIVENTGVALAQLKSVQKDYAEYGERLADVTSSLENNLEGAKQSDGEVAGAQDQGSQEKQPETSNSPEIPLRF